MTDKSSKTRLICPLTARKAQEMREDMARAVAAGADTIECRLDYIPPDRQAAALDDLLSNPPVDVIVTNRPRREGGLYDGDEVDRLAMLGEAAKRNAAFIDVELDTPQRSWPDAEIILSHHDFQRCPENLDELAATIEASDATINKVVFAATGPEDALRAFDVLRACDKPTIALAMGEAGVASRILAKKFGAFGTFAALSAGSESAPGQPTIEEMKQLYRWDSITPDTMVCGVIGCPVAHSMSPAIHNAAFTAAGLDAVYVPLLIQPGRDNFVRFADGVRDRPWLNWRGLSVTLPHKANALAWVGEDACDELARKIGSINTITFDPDGVIRGHNTDYAAALDALCDAMTVSREDLAGRRVTVLGAGGVARAIVAGLRHYQAEVSIYNRTFARAQRLAEEFACTAKPLEDASKATCEIIINCTSIGMHPNVDASPLAEIPAAAKVVFDSIYNPIETKLLRDAANAGCVTVTGLDMFVNQAVGQFEIWTDSPAPAQVMRQVVLDKLGKRHT